MSSTFGPNQLFKLAPDAVRGSFRVCCPPYLSTTRSNLGSGANLPLRLVAASPSSSATSLGLPL